MPRREKKRNGTIRHFELPDEDWVEDEDDGAWYVKATPVYRVPQGGWKPKPDSAEQKLWFVPELNGTEDTDPNSLTFPDWVTAKWDSQAGRWLVSLVASGSDTVFALFSGHVLQSLEMVEASPYWRSDGGGSTVVRLYNPYPVVVGDSPPNVVMAASTPNESFDFSVLIDVRTCADGT